jgi:hypothetical protein
VLQYKFIFFQPNIIPCQNDNLPMINHLVQWTSYLGDCKEGQLKYLRDRPFNLKGGVMVKIFIFLSRKAWIFFFQNSTLGYMIKTLNHIIFFFLHQNQNIFFSNIGNQNVFLEKNHNPPLQVKWLFPKYKSYSHTCTILAWILTTTTLSISICVDTACTIVFTWIIITWTHWKKLMF